jgi:Integrase core domain/HTH-like domain
MVAYIDQHRDDFGVEPICRELPIAPSTYYDTKARPPSTRSVGDAVMIPLLITLWAVNYRVYGARKLWKAARRAGHDVGRDQVARLMRVAGIEGIRRRRRVRTTRPDDTAVRHPDLVKRDFTATAPNQLWVTDLTFVATWSGAAYVCFIVDAFSRMIVGWRVAAHMRTPMVLDAVEMASWSRGARIVGLRCHSDAGSQGGINRSSQHLNMEVDDGQTAWVDGDADGEAVAAIAGSTADASSCGASVLGQDRRGADERGRGDRVRCVRSGRQPLVPRTWRHADHRVEPADGQVSVV